jgi:hypothetical protein
VAGVPPDAPDDAPVGPASALPPVAARVLAFVGILVGGACGLLIGMGVVDVQCNGDCSTPAAIGGFVGAVVGALGTAVVAVLALRAMGEWRTIQHGAASHRDYVFHAEDARGPSLLGFARGDRRDDELPAADEPAPGELGPGSGSGPASSGH